MIDQMEFDFTVVSVTVTHQPGTTNGNADALSRCCQTSLTGEGGRDVLDQRD